MTTWFSSDWHLSHYKVIEYSRRPFATIEEMNEKLLQNWNEKVAKKDVGYILGDFSFMKSADQTIDFIKRMNGEIHLILGNHDKSMKDRVRKQFASCDFYKEIRVDDPETPRGYQPIILCHFPILSWNKMHHNSYMLHGHCHGTLINNRGKRLDVGVDCHQYMPISYSRVKEIMKTKEFVLEDRHGSDERD